MKALKYKKYSVEEYLQLERTTGMKHEYIDGEVRAMSGGSVEHATISGNIFFELESRLRAKKQTCRTFNSDVKIYINKLSRYYYSDASVVCGELQISDEEKNAITNPVLIVEVLSDGTEKKDRTEKFTAYRKMASLQEYVLISQDKPYIEVFYRAPNVDLWKIITIEDLSHELQLQSVNLSIPLTDIYRDVNFDGV
ncbi:MAG: Uma2 family endonuclease [Bacteroidota bacterium]